MAAADKPTSLTLLERVRGRDGDAWQRLVHIYAPLVAQWCSYKGIRGQDADDVQQEVFHAVSTGLEGFRKDRPGDTFRGWLRIITRHKILDFHRKRERHPEPQGGTTAQLRLQEVAEQELPNDADDDLTGLYHRALELVRCEFEDRTWQAFWRSAVDGQAPDLVASQLGMSAAAVRKAKSRVLHRLRQELGDVID